jgi:hypothetical protein
MSGYVYIVRTKLTKDYKAHEDYFKIIVNEI